MRISRRVREIVFAVILVHPRCLEEATIMVRGSQWLTLLVENDNVLNNAVEREHVFAQFCNLGAQSISRLGFHAAVGSFVEFARCPALHYHCQ
jgi:hypothetical protein